MIDYWCNAFTPDREPLWQAVIESEGLSLRTRAGDIDDGFATTEQMVDRMDRVGIAALILPVCTVSCDAPLDDFGHYAVHPDELTALVTDHPGRFFGAYSVNPAAGDHDLASAAEALDHNWFVALHTHTHSWNRRFDHGDYRPYYELCFDKDVPFVMQAGGSGGNFAHECGHPDSIAGPAAAFPGVSFVLSHTGAPWVGETIAAASEFANVLIGTATHPPHRWPPELLDFLRGPGRDKVLFGTGFPLTGHSRSLQQLDELGIDEPTRQRLLEGNARHIFTRIAETTGD